MGAQREVAAVAGELWQINQPQSDTDRKYEREQSHHADSHLVVEVAQLRRKKSLAEAHARELAEELQQRNLEMDDLEQMFNESMALQKRDFEGIGRQTAGGSAMGVQLPHSSQDAFKAHAGRTQYEHRLWSLFRTV